MRKIRKYYIEPGKRVINTMEILRSFYKHQIGKSKFLTLTEGKKI